MSALSSNAFCYVIVTPDGPHPSGCLSTVKQAKQILTAEGGEGWRLETHQAA